MAVSLFDIFTIGIGPSSSHTVGPMRAARRFASLLLQDRGREKAMCRLWVELFGSLALTGKGHGTDKAILMGLEGEEPERVDPVSIPERVARIQTSSGLNLQGEHRLEFQPERDLVFHRTEMLPRHPNGMRFTALDSRNRILLCKIYYSVGGGFVLSENSDATTPETESSEVPFPFSSAEQLLEHCRAGGFGIDEVMWRNERTWRGEAEIEQGLLSIWQAMQECVRAGCRHQGLLPGGLKVRRRAPEMYARLGDHTNREPLAAMDHVNLYALAVNEENAAGGRVVTAPTNGAAGVLPAVLHYYDRFVPGADERGVFRFLLTAAAICLLYKENASISGAEVGCQGEVGVACSMAAAGLTAVQNGTPEQVENAAEIGMEHHLGLTCDPVAGLVQIPCIERNAMGALKSINAARLALQGDGLHHVSLDKVIETMRQTGADMRAKYKETSRGGLAVNVIEC